MNSIVRFDDLPLGARFQFLSRKEVWVKLDGADRGRVVRFVPVRSNIPQTVCSAATDDDQRARLRVHACDAIENRIEQETSVVLSWRDPDHPYDFRQISHEVMFGGERLGHVVTNGYDDHLWTFYPDPTRVNGSRPVTLRTEDPNAALPAWVKKMNYTLLSVEDSEAIYAQAHAEFDAARR